MILFTICNLDVIYNILWMFVCDKLVLLFVICANLWDFK